MALWTLAIGQIQDFQIGQACGRQRETLATSLHIDHQTPLLIRLQSHTRHVLLLLNLTIASSNLGSLDAQTRR